MGQRTRAFPLDGTTRYLCIDMQRLFAEATPWQVPWLPRVLPCVHEIASRHASSTIFTRFIPPRSAGEAVGAWRDYYEAWPDLTRQALAPELLELVSPLRALVPPAYQLDKSANSAFSHPGFADALHRRGVTTLVVTGGRDRHLRAGDGHGGGGLWFPRGAADRCAVQHERCHA